MAYFKRNCRESKFDKRAIASRLAAMESIMGSSIGFIVSEHWRVLPAQTLRPTAPGRHRYMAHCLDCHCSILAIRPNRS